jgi:Sulfotransferase domain
MNERRAGRLPDFIAVGPPRTATTWLDAVLRGHVGLPAGTKETHFFTRSYSKGLDWYCSHFEHCPPQLPVGEICTSYFRSSTARERLSKDIPGCKIICTLRDPIEQLYSAYKLLRLGYVEGSFEEVLRDRNLLKTTRYAHHVKAWQKCFGKQNVLVTFFDDLKANSQTFLDQVTDFIGIRSIGLVEAHPATEPINSIRQAPFSPHLARHARGLRTWLGSQRLYRTTEFLDRLGVWRLCFGGGQVFPPLDPGAESRLRSCLRTEVEKLEVLLQRDLSPWKGGTGSPRQVGFDAQVKRA